MLDLSSLPSLSSLYCFMCASKHGSFTLAAEEMHITQSAVSHRIRKLENELGVKLFQRFTRKLVLTEEGKQLSVVLENSLGDISSEIRNIRKQELDGELNITAPPSFLGCWLLPRLVLFRKQYPGIHINIQTRLDLVDFRTEAIDVAIYYGDGQYPGLSVTPLMQEVLVPVCSPSFADEHGLWDNPKALSDCLLLHDGTAWPKAQFFSEWKEWSSGTGVSGLVYDHSYTFDRSDLAANGAIHGIGVAMGRLKLVKRRLDSGELVVPFDLPAVSQQEYYVATSKDRQYSSRISAFTEWLMEQAELSEDANLK